MSYSIEIKASAERELEAIPEQFREKIGEAILALEEDPRPIQSIKLKGGNGFRLRVGNYRVLYTLNHEDLKVWIYAIGDRKEVYRQ